MSAGTMSGFAAPDLYTVLKESVKDQGELTAQYEAAMGKRKEYFGEALEALRTQLKAGATTGSRIRDHVIAHRGFDPQYEEWYARVETRLKGYGGQLVMLRVVMLERQEPLIRHMHDEARMTAATQIAPVRRSVFTMYHYRIAVLTAEELGLAHGAAAIPTGPQAKFSAREEVVTSPLFDREMEEWVRQVMHPAPEMFPLPRSMAGDINFSIRHLAPLIGGFAFEDRFVEDELFVGDDEVGEVFKKYGWPEKFWLACLNQVGRLELVPPDEQVG